MGLTNELLICIYVVVMHVTSLKLSFFFAFFSILLYLGLILAFMQIHLGLILHRIFQRKSKSVHIRFCLNPTKWSRNFHKFNQNLVILPVYFTILQ